MIELRDRVATEVGKVVVGQERGRRRPARRRCCVGGHVLLEGVPGVAKTLLANATARALGLDVPPRAVHARHAAVRPHRDDDASRRRAASSGRGRCSRTSCSPTRSTARRRRRRPRCSRRCRSARSRSTASRTRSPTPFLVVATQNPIEYEGTYPLPEAQLDRFLFKLDVGYPDEEDELAMLELAHRGVAPADARRRRSRSLDAARAAARRARTSTRPASRDEVVALRRRARAQRRASCRASSSAPARARPSTCSRRRRRSARLGRARLRHAGRRRRGAPAVLRHRLVLRPEAELERYTPDDAIEAALAAVARAAVSPDAAHRASRCAALARRGARSSRRGSLVLAAGRPSLAAIVVDALRGPRERPRSSREVPRVARPRGVPAPLRARAPRGRRAGALRVRQPRAAGRRARARARPTARSTRDARRRAAAAATCCRRRPSRAHGPLGLGRWYHRAGEERELRRLPRPAGRAAARAARSGAGRFRDEGRRARGPLGLGTEFESIRDYLAGRRHPPGQLARDGAARPADEQPVPRRAGPRRHLRGRLRPADGGAARRRDAARRRRRRRGRASRRSRTSSATAAARSRSTARSAATSAPRRAGGRARRRGALRPRAAAGRQPTTSSRSAASASAKRAFVLVFTDLLEESAARPLAEALPVLARRHAVAVASAPTPDLDELLTAEPRAAVDVYRAAVAAEVLAARARAVAARFAARAPTSSRRRPDALARRVRQRVPEGEGAGASLDADPRHERRAPSRPRASAKPTRERTRQRRVPAGVHEALDEPGERRATARCRARSRAPARLALQRRRARVPQPGLDERPAHPQPGRAGDDDARELEHAVGRDELDERRAVAGADREPADRAEQDAVEDQHAPRSAAPTVIPPANASERDADVVREDLRSRTPPARPASPRSLSARARLGRRCGTRSGTSPSAAPGSASAQPPRERGRAEEQQTPRGERDAAAPQRAASSRARRSDAGDAAARARVVDEAARARATSVLEPRDDRIAGERAPREREVGRGRAVEGAEARARRPAPSRSGLRAGARTSVSSSLPRLAALVARNVRGSSHRRCEYEDRMTIATPRASS